MVGGCTNAARRQAARSAGLHDRPTYYFVMFIWDRALVVVVGALRCVFCVSCVSSLCNMAKPGNAAMQLSPVRIAASNGYSRSQAGNPWGTASVSLTEAQTATQASTLTASPSWGNLLFRSTYSSSFAPHSRDQARLLNHQRLDLSRSASRIELPGRSATSLENSLERLPSQPFGGLSTAVWHR